MTCNHDVSNKEFKFCPYCGEKLPQPFEVEAVFQVHRGGQLGKIVNYGDGRTKKEMKPIEYFNIANAANYVATRTVNDNKDFNYYYYEPTLSLIDKFNDETFLATESGYDTNYITILKNAGLLGVAGKEETTITIDDDNDICKKIEIYRYCINPYAMNVLDMALENIVERYEAKYNDTKRRYENLLSKYDKKIKKYTEIQNEVIERMQSE